MNKKLNVIIILISLLFLTKGCAYRMIDGSTLVNNSYKNAELNSLVGKEVEGNKYYPYMIEYNIQDAIDEAFENAGEEYDMLINTTIDIKQYYFVIYHSQYVIVKGTAVNSNTLKTSMGEEKYNEWFATQNVIYRSEEFDQ